jgi:hypothetical protein
MRALTLRLDDDLHDRLKLLAVATHKSVNQIITELAAEAADRAFGPRRTPRPGEAAERLRKVMGWDSVPTLSDEQRAGLRARQDASEAEAERIYSKPSQSAA